MSAIAIAIAAAALLIAIDAKNATDGTSNPENTAGAAQLSKEVQSLEGAVDELNGVISNLDRRLTKLEDKQQSDQQKK